MVPKRSAIGRANGWPKPQRMFWIASARPNTSRPQPLACDMGVRKKPSVARGPKLIIETRQPHKTITAGVRHPIVEAFVAEGNETAMTGNPYPESVNNSYNKKEATIALRDPVPCGSSDRNRSRLS